MSNIYPAKAYPKLNNEDILEFQVPQSKFQVQLSEVYLHFIVHIDQSKISGGDLIPQNWFAAKQFSSVEIKLNDESVSRRSMPHEYALSAYINSLVNYSKGLVKSGCRSIGVFDDSNLVTTQIEAMVKKGAWTRYIRERKSISDTYAYEIIMPIDNTLFYSDNLLPSGQKWSLSFERAETKYSTLVTDTGADVTDVPKVLPLEDVYLMIPYTADEKMKRRESNWINKPIALHYDKYQLQRYSLESGTNYFRLPNIINGKLPKALFFGILTDKSYFGSFTESSTLFKRHSLIEVDLLQNGTSMPGMPMKMSDDHVTIPYVRFLQLTGKFLEKNTTSVVSLQAYNDYNFLQCATFPEDSTGSLSVELSFTTNVPEGLILVVFSIYDVKMEIDKFGNFTTN